MDPLHLEHLLTALALSPHAFINDPSERERVTPVTGFRITRHDHDTHFCKRRYRAKFHRLRVRVGWAVKCV
jgi:hypothetical protein